MLYNTSQLETFLDLRVYHDIMTLMTTFFIFFSCLTNGLSHSIPPSLFLHQSQSFILSLSLYFLLFSFSLLLWLFLVLLDMYMVPDVIRNLICNTLFSILCMQHSWKLNEQSFRDCFFTTNTPIPTVIELF